MKKHNFNAGPSILPAVALEAAAKAIIDFNGTGLSLLSISHRTPDFEAVLDEFNDLTEEELNQLAVLLEAEDAEAAFSAVLGTWINVNVINTMGELYNAFADNPNEKTAAALIEYYDSIYNDPSYKDEEFSIEFKIQTQE